MEFRDTEFYMHKAYKEFKNIQKKAYEHRFSNADSIRSLEDNSQLALKLWNIPKFKTIEELAEWLGKEYRQ